MSKIRCEVEISMAQASHTHHQTDIPSYRVTKVYQYADPEQERYRKNEQRQGVEVLTEVGRSGDKGECHNRGREHNDESNLLQDQGPVAR